MAQKKWIQPGTMRLWVDPWPRSVSQGSGVAVSCGVGCRRGSDLALLWLWRRPAATAPIRLLVWEPPFVRGVALKRQKTGKKKKKFKRSFTLLKRSRLRAISNNTSPTTFFFPFFIPFAFITYETRHSEICFTTVTAELGYLKIILKWMRKMCFQVVLLSLTLF